MAFSLNFGMPRTGTTFMETMMRQSEENFHEKLTEGHEYHPVKGCELKQFTEALARRHVILIRTYRDPVEHYSSMARAKEKGGFPKHTLERHVEWQWNEVNNWKRVVERLCAFTQAKVTFVELDFDNLHQVDIGRIPGADENVMRFFIENYKRKPVREGRLSEGKKVRYEVPKMPDPRVIDGILEKPRKKTIKPW